MNNQRKDKLLSSLLLRGGWALLVLFACLAIEANGQTQTDNSAAISPIHVTHVLGFENLRRNFSGELSIDNETLSFLRDGILYGRVTLSSIQNIYLGEQDKQVGGVPMMLGKAAVPFEGGRVVSLFSHKKYDSLVIEYFDDTGGFHAGIFRLPRGQGETFKNAVIARRTLMSPSEDPASLATTLNELGSVQTWSMQVNRIDPGTTTVDATFSDAIYENLLRALNKSKQFNHVYRSGDRTANQASGLLVLKTVVEKYSPGSETKRAVTTVAGATKLKVQIQLVTPDGRVVMEHTVASNVRFMGDNLAATNKVANKTAKRLKRSTLPALTAQMAQEANAKAK